MNDGLATESHRNTTLRSAQERARTIRELFPDGLAATAKSISTHVGVLARYYSFAGVPVRGDVGWRADGCSLSAKVSGDLRAALRNLLQQFGNQLAPGPFRVPKMWSC